MMVETILESSQDFSMSSGALPQWKRELLQRRLARSRPSAAPAPPPPPPPPPPPAADDDEELRYGPGIVKRLKSRYLSLALRDAPRRRPSVLRRAASLEHLLDERPPPAPRAPRAPRPASLAAPLSGPAAGTAPPHARRDLVKRARSVDALSRLEPRDEPPPSPEPARGVLAAPRAPRPPRRPQPLLRDAERPPPDVVRSTLRKFESAPSRRAAPAARVSAVLRGLEPRRTPTPDGPEPRSPSPAARDDLPPTPEPQPEPEPPTDSPPSVPTTPIPPIVDPPRSLPPPVPIERPSPPASPVELKPAPAPPPAADEVEGAAPSTGARLVSRAALEEIARAGCSVRYAFGAGRPAAHLPPLAATNPVLAARGLRRVGVIRPMPVAERSPAASPSPPPRGDKTETRLGSPDASPERSARVNGHSTPEPGALSRIGAAGIERAWSGSAVKHVPEAPRPAPPPAADARPSWARGGGGGARSRAPAAATSVVFNFSNRKEVPDYIENDGIILRASRRTRFKAGEPGVVLLRAAGEAGAAGADSDSETEEAAAGPPSPCDVRFVNDNVLINGRSSMPATHNKDRIAKLKLQFDDSLTRTFEYPSETSFSDELLPPSPSPPAGPPDDNCASLADNTHIASAALSRYTPSKTCAAAFQLGVSNPRPAAAPPAVPPAAPTPTVTNGACGDAEGAGGEEARACGAGVAPSWSDARAHRTDLLF